MNHDPYKIITLIQGSPEWHVWRRTKITASMAGIIMGLSPFETPLALYNKILSGEEIPDNHHMRRGRETEPEARLWATERTGNLYEPVCAESIETPWMGCSLDGWCEFAETKAVEIKCPDKSVEQFALLDEIPATHLAQMQHQMYVMGLDKMYYITYSKYSQDGVIITVNRDDLFIQKMIDALNAFRLRLINFDPPEPTDKDYIQIVDPEAIELAKNYDSICLTLKNLEYQKEEARKALIAKTGDKNCNIGNLRMTKTFSKGRVDYDKIEILKDMDLSPYRKPPIVSWRIS